MGTLGHLLATNLASFPGEIVPVRNGESLRDVPGEIDLAVVAVPAHAVPAVAAEAAAKGVTAMVVLSGGFAETGEDGARLQAELIANAGATRVIGPNCFGIQNCDLPLNASMAAGLPRGGGGICLVSQSGAYGMAIFTMATDERVRFAKILAPGNTCDVTIAELLGELADDPAAATLCFLLESLADGRAFVERARAVTPTRPVVVVKTGRSEAGARAASSHTAALAADAAIWRGVFRQAGIVEVASGQELLDAARALDGQPLPAGPRVAIITNSGGVSVELADLLADEGLTVPALSSPLQDKIRAMLPAFASPVNPVDITPVWSRFAELYPGLTDLLARSGEVDVVIPVLLQRAALDTATAEGLRDVVATLRTDDIAVPVHVCWVAPRDARPNADLLQDARIPCFEWPARTARAIGHARRYALARERTTPAAPVPARRTGPTSTDPAEAAALLAELGIHT
ncbi:MAG: CoA-binding protein, partial [Pseudonocardiales bacterium]|nr:CoA-binding protein [Pseudonocardiales bacterium]